VDRRGKKGALLGSSAGTFTDPAVGELLEKRCCLRVDVLEEGGWVSVTFSTTGGG